MERGDGTARSRFPGRKRAERGILCRPDAIRSGGQLLDKGPANKLQAFPVKVVVVVVVVMLGEIAVVAAAAQVYPLSLLSTSFFIILLPSVIVAPGSVQLACEWRARSLSSVAHNGMKLEMF